MKNYIFFSTDIKWCIFLIVTILCLSSTFISRTLASKQYRTDYVYNSKTDAFYKLHMETALFSQTHELCAIEGATLMVPRSDEDIAQVHGLFKQYPDIGNTAWVGNDGKEHESAEEIPIINLDTLHITTDRWGITARGLCDVVTRAGEAKRINCFAQKPFVCKVKAGDVVEDKTCKVFCKGYRYFENVGSCYKIPRVAYQWNQAYAECRAEGAHLVVLNSGLERQVIYNITNEEPAVDKAFVSWFFFAGIRAEKKLDGSPRVFKTIFNQTLEEAGYSQWSDNEPNNSEGKEYCVSIFKNDGKYNDINCLDPLAFICEKEV